jgi:hypothetical protein
MWKDGLSPVKPSAHRIGTCLTQFAAGHGDLSFMGDAKAGYA